jgi:hypothetical protein
MSPTCKSWDLIVMWGLAHVKSCSSQQSFNCLPFNYCVLGLFTFWIHFLTSSIDSLIIYDLDVVQRFPINIIFMFLCWTILQVYLVVFLILFLFIDFKFISPMLSFLFKNITIISHTPFLLQFSSRNTSTIHKCFYNLLYFVKNLRFLFKSFFIVHFEAFSSFIVKTQAM